MVQNILPPHFYNLDFSFLLRLNCPTQYIIIFFKLFQSLLNELLCSSIKLGKIKVISKCTSTAADMDLSKNNSDIELAGNFQFELIADRVSRMKKGVNGEQSLKSKNYWKRGDIFKYSGRASISL